MEGLHPGDELHGQISLAALTIAELRAMFLTIGRRHHALGTPLSATALHGIRCTFRAALNGAIREGLLTDNPARWVELPSHRRPHPVVWRPARVAAWKAGGPRPTAAVWTAADTSRFLTAIETDDLRPLLYLVALRGLREDETVGTVDPGSAPRAHRRHQHPACCPKSPAGPWRASPLTSALRAGSTPTDRPFSGR